MIKGETVTIKKWIGLEDCDHTWAFYYWLKRSDRYEVKVRNRDNKVDILIKEKEVYE